MKKKLMLLVGLIMLLVLSACGENDNNTASSEANDNDNTNSNDTYELDLGMQPNPNSNEYEAAEHLAEYVEEESDGQMTIELFPDAQLGDDLEMLGQLQSESLDITLTEMGRLGEWVPRAKLLAVPYVIEDFNHIQRVVYDTDYGKELRKELEDEHNLRIMGSAYNGTRVTSSNSEINELADMEGMDLRVPEADTLLDFAEYVGANPIPMNLDEVYLALQTGQVDGQDNPLPGVEANSFHEVQDYIALTNHVVNDNSYAVSQLTWEKLPEDMQEILSNGIDEATDYHTELFEEEEEELIEYFEDEGVTVTEPDLEEFKEALSEVYPEYYEEIGDGAEEYMDIIDEARE